MRQIKCPDCNETCIKHGVLKSGSQRWFCKHCKVAFTVKINNLSKELSLFVNDTLRMYKNDDIRMYNFNCITDTIVEVITTCNTYTLLT
ncbi:hypothetical protein O3610_09920, partial [Veillonella atypica]|uniref:transposase-like zinc-binding domain-containing protein n=1 Tax=Veillonella atypica TaxID=39777 RepID=UPI00355374EF